MKKVLVKFRFLLLTVVSGLLISNVALADVADFSDDSFEEKASGYEMENGANSALSDSESSGTCGDNLTWEISYQDGLKTLTINGTGDMFDYSNYSYSPWKDLRQVIINEGVTSISDRAFAFCWDEFDNEVYDLYQNKISIPASVRKIGADSFLGGRTICEVNYGGSENEWNAIQIINQHPAEEDHKDWINCLNGARVYCKKDRKYIEEVTRGRCGANIQWYLLHNADNMDLLTLKLVGEGDMDDYESDGRSPWKEYFSSYGFKNYAISRIDMDDRITRIGTNAFYTSMIDRGYSNKLEKLVLPEMLQSIGDNGLHGIYASNTIVDVPEGVTEIGSGALTGFKGIYFRGAAPKIEPYTSGIGLQTDGSFGYNTVVFYNENKEGWTSPKWCGYECFSGNPHDYVNFRRLDDGVIGVITEVKKGEYLLTIKGEGNGWYRDEKGTEDPFPSEIKHIIVEKGITDITAAFSSDEGTFQVEDVILPDTVLFIGNSAFDNCKKLTSVTIPAIITNIGYGAFDRCESLKYIYFGGTMEQWKSIAVDVGNDYLSQASIHCSDGIINGKQTDNNESAEGGDELHKDLITAANLNTVYVSQGGYTVTLSMNKTVPFTKKKREVVSHLNLQLDARKTDGTAAGISVKKVKSTKPKKGSAKVTVKLKGSTKEEKKAVKKLNRSFRKISIVVDSAGSESPVKK